MTHKSFINTFFISTFFIILLLTLIANPAPVSIEWEDILLILLPFFVSVLALVMMRNHTLTLQQSNLILAVILYLIFLLISLLMSIFENISLLGSLRSLGPYINFFPLILVGLIPKRIFYARAMAIIFILVGLLQACYQLYVYFNHSFDVITIHDVLKSRITFIEPRTTLPLILSLTTLPLILITRKSKLLQVSGYSLIFLGFLAGAVTLTRSILISIVIGWITFYIISLIFKYQTNIHLFKSALIKTFFFICMITILFWILSFIPAIHSLQEGVFARFSFSSQSDYSNGRLYDEWLPALNTWLHADFFHLIFGIGAGHPFHTITGEERTYIHNLMIYDLVYGGIYGLFATLFLYYTLFKTLLHYARVSQQFIYIGFAALLMSMFTYAQFFAVHKGLAFNAMLFMIITLALGTKKENNRYAHLDH